MNPVDCDVKALNSHSFFEGMENWSIRIPPAVLHRSLSVVNPPPPTKFQRKTNRRIMHNPAKGPTEISDDLSDISVSPPTGPVTETS